jgi:hypothetical protein
MNQAADKRSSKISFKKDDLQRDLPFMAAKAIQNDNFG